jgi:NADH-quinone oxidoreductase subunit H
MAEWFASLDPIWQALIRVLLFVVPLLLMVAAFIWGERRLLGFFQDRVGPNRVGNITLKKRDKRLPPFLRGKKIRLFGLLQPVADITKLLLKEDIMPSAVDKFVYLIAPGIALFPSFALGATIPWGPFRNLTPVADVEIGVLWILAISALGVYGVVLSGYSSNNKYSLLGGLRSSAQLISYELGMTLSLAAIAMATGSLKMTAMVEAQEGPLWGIIPGLSNWFILTPYGAIAAVVFGISMVAETNRAPFDLPEAENELVAGYHTEYSSMKFAAFFMGEYAALGVYGAIFSTVFLGGWHMLPVRWEGIAENAPMFATFAGYFQWADFWLAPVWFIGKIALVFFGFVWIRATLPRLRYDQLMSLGWRTLLPVATVNLIVVAAFLLLQELYGGAVALIVSVAAFAALYVLFRAVTNTRTTETAKKEEFLPSRTVRMVELNAPKASSGTSNSSEEPVEASVA